MIKPNWDWVYQDYYFIASTLNQLEEFPFQKQLMVIVMGTRPTLVIVKKEPIFSYIDSDVDSVYDSYLKTDSKDDSILVYPSKGKQSIPIEKSEKEGVSVYFLFKKKPSEGHWKLYINPDSQKDKTVNISKNNVMKVS